MKTPGNIASGSHRREQSVQALARVMREILGSVDFESENHRKAALRRLLHEHSACLNREEIEKLVRNLRDRFPDRIFESERSSQLLTIRSAELEKEVVQLEEERNRFRKEVDRQRALMAHLVKATRTPTGLGRSSVGGISTKPSPTPETPEALVEVAALLFSFALDQEQAARFVDEALGGDSTGHSSNILADIFPRLMGKEGVDREGLESIHHQLQSLKILPGALMTGAQQSWKGGTREILEHLDPKAVKSSILGVPNYPTILKEVERRFEEFWDQFDRNIEHYYRGRFERVFKDKMEGEL